MPFTRAASGDVSRKVVIVIQLRNPYLYYGSRVEGIIETDELFLSKEKSFQVLQGTRFQRDGFQSIVRFARVGLTSVSKPRIWLECTIVPSALERLTAVAEVIPSADPADLPGSHAAIISSRPAANGMFMDRAGDSLRVIARPGVGVDNVDVLAATERGILVINTPDAPSESTAEMAVTLLLAFSRRLILGDRKAHGEPIPHVALAGIELRGKVLGIVGFGRIGRRVAEICRFGLKMRVIVYDPYLDENAKAALDILYVENIESLLEQADFVTLHTPLTKEMRGFFDETRLRQMKRGASLINVSRGPVISETALLNVLMDGHLAGAALDVFDTEPPPIDHPLPQLPNVIATPHIGSYTAEATEAMGESSVMQVIQVLRGERPPFLLDPAAWPGRTQPGVAVT